MNTVLGQFAALGAAFAFGLTSTMFTLAGRKYGALAVLRSSLPVSLFFMFLVHLALTGTALPLDAGIRWVWLGLSGIMGFWWGFIAVLNAFILIGPRLSLLIGASAPILSSIIAWLVYDEILEIQAVFGIILTIAGIIWVISERKQKSPTDIDPQKFRLGLLFAVVGALAQAASALLSKQGLQGDFDPISASLIRLGVATVAIWIFAFVRGQMFNDFKLLRANPSGMRFMGVGSVSGPVIGASLLMFAFSTIPVGIAMTLSNLTPILLIPVGYLVFHEQITRRSIVGTFIAVVGTAVLFL